MAEENKETKTEEKGIGEKIKSIGIKKDKSSEALPDLVREYIVPLRKSFLKVPRYKRAKKAVKTIKEFLARHMKIRDRDLSKVKIDINLNNEVWFRGIKKPPARIKVKATKRGEIVYAELSEIPEAVKYRISKISRRKEIKEEPKREEKKEESLEKKVEDEKKESEKAEKEKAVIEAGLKEQKELAKASKHTTKAGHKKKTAPVQKKLK